MFKNQNTHGIEEIIPAEDQFASQMKQIKGGGLLGGKKCKSGCANGKKKGSKDR